MSFFGIGLRKAGEIAMQFCGCLPVGCIRLLCRGVQAQVNLFAELRNLRGPLSFFMFPYAFDAAFVVRTHPTILRILPNRGDSKIAFAVVKTIAIYVIHYARIISGEAHDKTVHSDRTSPFVVDLRPIISSIKIATVSNRVPRHLRKPPVILWIDLYRKAASHLNKAIICVWGCHAWNCLRVGFVRCDQHLTSPLYIQGGM